MEMTNETIARIDNLDKNRPTVEKFDAFGSGADLVKSFDGIDANFKRRISRNVNKAYMGQDDAKSKQLFPEKDITTAYGLFDVVVPPYNLDELAFFYDNSFANHAAINAKVSNTVGIGYNFIMTDSVKQRLEEMESQDQRTRAQRKVERVKTQLVEWLEELNDEDTFTHVLEKAMIDYETVHDGVGENVIAVKLKVNL
jgi:capsid portal protein